MGKMLIIGCPSVKHFCVVQRTLPAGQRGGGARGGKKLVPLLELSSLLLGPAQHSRGSCAASTSHNSITHCGSELHCAGRPLAFSLRGL